MARQSNYVDILVKRPVKIALQDFAKHGETYGQAIMRLINFYNVETKKAGVSSPGLINESTSLPNGAEL